MKKTYIYAKAYYDKYFFIDFFLPAYGHIIEETKKESPGYFEELWKYLDNGIDIVLILPRGHAKTTGILIRILYNIVYKETKGILYIAGGALGQKGVGKIRGELETNELLKDFFGNLVPANSDDIKDRQLKKRKTTFLEFTNGCWLETLTMGQSVRGGRPNKIIGDDVQENKDVRNKNIVERFNSWVFTSLYNTLLPGGSMAVVGTVVGELCLVKHLRDEMGRKTIEYQACDDNFENILRPEMRSKEALIERRKKIGTANFNQEYRNIPLQESETLVKPQWIRYYEKLPKKFDKTYLTIDPAVTTKTSSDYTGRCYVGHLKDTVYVIKAGQVKLTPLQNEEFIYSLYLRLKPSYVIKEDNIEVGMTEHLKKRGVRIKSIKAKKDKFTRLLDITSNIEYGKVLFNTDIDDELIYQLTHFPDILHDDLLDAFIYGVNGIKTKSFGIFSL